MHDLELGRETSKNRVHQSSLPRSQDMMTDLPGAMCHRVNPVCHARRYCPDFMLLLFVPSPLGYAKTRVRTCIALVVLAYHILQECRYISVA